VRERYQSDHGLTASSSFGHALMRDPSTPESMFRYKGCRLLLLENKIFKQKLFIFFALIVFTLILAFINRHAEWNTLFDEKTSNNG
jgi:hypothetical protein